MFYKYFTESNFQVGTYRFLCYCISVGNVFAFWEHKIPGPCEQEHVTYYSLHVFHLRHQHEDEEIGPFLLFFKILTKNMETIFILYTWIGEDRRTQNPTSDISD